MRDFLARHRPIAAFMHVAHRKTGHMAEKLSRQRWIGVFVYVAHKGEIWVRGGLSLDEVWERYESEIYRACQMREVQIPAKLCTSRTGKRPPSPKSHREVKKTGLFCTSRMGKGNKSRIANHHQWHMHEKPAN